MAEKQKSAQKSRAHKESKHEHGSARKFPGGGMSELQKVLIANGGMIHSTHRLGRKRLGNGSFTEGGRKVKNAKVGAE